MTSFTTLSLLLPVCSNSLPFLLTSMVVIYQTLHVTNSTTNDGGYEHDGLRQVGADYWPYSLACYPGVQSRCTIRGNGVLLYVVFWCANATEKRMPIWDLLLIALNSIHHPYDISLAERYSPWYLRSFLYRSKILKSVFLIHSNELLVMLLWNRQLYIETHYNLTIYLFIFLFICFIYRFYQ